MKLGKVQFLKNTPARGSLFLLEETDLLASGNHFFFSIFQRDPPFIAFFKNPGKYFQRAGIMFFFKNWPRRNFKNGVHQQKRALNKSTMFAINRKPVSTSHNEGYLEKYDFTGSKNCFHLNQCLKN